MNNAVKRKYAKNVISMKIECLSKCVPIPNWSISEL